jgi:DNA-binding HxlR family transcriptional regulator
MATRLSRLRQQNHPPTCGQWMRSQPGFPRVEYSLTDLGLSLDRTDGGIRGWAYEHMSHIEESRRLFDSNAIGT